MQRRLRIIFSPPGAGVVVVTTTVRGAEATFGGSEEAKLLLLLLGRLEAVINRQRALLAVFLLFLLPCSLKLSLEKKLG